MKLTEQDINEITEVFKSLALENFTALDMAEVSRQPDIIEIFGKLSTRVARTKVDMVAGESPWVQSHLDDILRRHGIRH